MIAFINTHNLCREALCCAKITLEKPEVPRHNKRHMNPSKQPLGKVSGHFTKTKSKMDTLSPNSQSPPLHVLISQSKVKPGSSEGDRNDKEHSSASDLRETKKCKYRCWKVCKDKPRMVIREDISLDEVPYMLGKTLVSHFYGKVVFASSLSHWLDSNWRDVIGYSPEFQTMARGWLCFKFKTNENMMRAWGRGPSSVVLKECTISFNPTRDALAPTKIWVILPNLLMVFWEEEVMESIGNKTWRFICCEPD
jgi:hypothetical protein